jgi:hypothetical protein
LLPFDVGRFHWRAREGEPFWPTARRAVIATPPTDVPRVPASKLVVPELPAEFAPRPRLRHLLDRAAADQVIVLSAPGGSGKTLLLAD